MFGNSYNRNNGTIAENSIVAREKLTIGNVRLTANGGLLSIDGPMDVKSLTINGLPLTGSPRVVDTPKQNETTPKQKEIPRVTETNETTLYTTGCSDIKNAKNLNVSLVTVGFQYQDTDLGECIMHNMGLSVDLLPGAVLEFGKIGFDLVSPYLDKYPLPDTFVGKRSIGCEAITGAHAIIGTWFVSDDFKEVTTFSLSFEAELVSPNEGSLVFGECPFTWTCLK
jgi:hypothetical protein